MNWLKDLICQIKQNYGKQPKIERAYWFIICVSIIIFGIYIKVLWFSLFISLAVVFLGTLALEDHKNVILMLAAFLFTIVTFHEQNKRLEIQLNTQLDSLKNQIASLELSKKQVELQYTPDIRSYVTCRDIYNGTQDPDPSKPGRMDDYIVIPITIYNRTYGHAKDITLIMRFNYGAVDKTLETEIPLIRGGESFNNVGRLGFSPSLDSGFRESFLNGKKLFKMKIILDWKDASGKKYKSVENFTLTTEKEGLDAPLMFIFKSGGFFSSIDNDIKIVNGHADKKIDF